MCAHGSGPSIRKAVRFDALILPLLSSSKARLPSGLSFWVSGIRSTFEILGQRTSPLPERSNFLEIHAGVSC